MTSCLAVVCVRNEILHIRRCLTDLIESGLDVHLIDNGSTDGTREIAEHFLGKGLSHITDLPWTGAFSLTDQLDAKSRVLEASHHDWLLHCDADEWLVNPVEGQTILDGMAEAQSAGYNCINFHEAVFVPLPGEDFAHPGYAGEMTNYYFFQPTYPRLQRAWRRDAHLSNRSSGGHNVGGGQVRIFPRDFILRHYIMLSEAQGRRKYVGRKYAMEDASKGWHSNRTIITADNLRVRPIPQIRRLAHSHSRKFDLSQPITRHFWQWWDAPEFATPQFRHGAIAG